MQCDVQGVNGHHVGGVSVSEVSVNQVSKANRRNQVNSVESHSHIHTFTGPGCLASSGRGGGGVARLLIDKGGPCGGFQKAGGLESEASATRAVASAQHAKPLSSRCSTRDAHGADEQQTRGAGATGRRALVREDSPGLAMVAADLAPIPRLGQRGRESHPRLARRALQRTG